MRAVQYQSFSGPLELTEVPEPTLPPHGALIEVAAAGMCRSDWHGWVGHDPDITLPQIPGHEWAGTVRAVGDQVHRWSGGERVTAPFVCGCGRCELCAAGRQQVCAQQTQPGFTHEGAFAERLVVHHADVNLVALPEDLPFDAAAALGCRFATAYRAVVLQGGVRPGGWVAIHGCGGVGLSAVMIAAAAGARIVALDIADKALGLAFELGADLCLNVVSFGQDPVQVGAAVKELTGGGVALSIDALGSLTTSSASVHSLTRQGRHVQVGLLPSALGVPPLPMDLVVAHELEIVGSHGMAAHDYPAMLAAVAAGRLQPQRLVTRRVRLADAPALFPEMSDAPATGITIIDVISTETD
ncbi:zinc-dependent alcohol dehydrogenase family protein [Leekyejoonella antrihumi]|uniref:Zinc-dependent alcohol dehydrogenase family protein n=1 Tax=Leekyejoonella antrihumi TaxID=1660198 RepID=A0A563E2C9_9MICO|nr:zinc-dependent alcohol dehydrogenase family protein [Leekyejoonella antrihumi]TWP36700.1 zinc-dependent alcohol dehydrogenase family protein [Leekyejoonella antrihumi]